jgi:V8-like Glu-specific endopeptidase
MTTNKHVTQIAIGMTVLAGFVAALFIAPEIGASGAFGLSPYPPPNESGVIPTAKPYPAPGEASQIPETGMDSNGCKDLKSRLPTDHVVAVSSDCQISDFESQAQTLSKQYEDPNSHDLIMPPSYPRSKDSPENVVEPLRVIGPDDRIQINDTTVFPWSTVVKVEGQWNSTDFFACTGWMLGPSTIVTAGHCVYNFDGTKTYAYNVTITPALTTSSSAHRNRRFLFPMSGF